MNDEQIRKDFEEWMGDGGLSPRAIERNSKGDYILMQAAHAWEVWKAAHTHCAKSAAPVVLPEPVSARYRLLGVTGLGWTPCYLEFARSQAGGVYELEYLYTEQQVRELLARDLGAAPQPQADALDTERLDWLIEQGRSNGVVYEFDKSFWIAWLDGYDAHKDEHQIGRYQTAREAIDAAIAAAKEKP